jgi:hypothetical protein
MDGCCPICYEDLEQSPSSKLLICMHEFHIECIHKWLKIRPNCPLCRLPLESTFEGKQKFNNKHFVDCEISLDNLKKLNIKYDYGLKVSLPFEKIKTISIDQKFTNVEYKHFDELVTLKFKINQAFYFLECFRNKVHR